MPESYIMYHFLPFRELETVPPFKLFSFLQQPQANQELEAVPPKS